MEENGKISHGEITRMVAESKKEVLDDIAHIAPNETLIKIEQSIAKYRKVVDKFVTTYKNAKDETEFPVIFDSTFEIIQKSWSTPTYGHHIGSSLSNTLRVNGGFDILIEHSVSDQPEILLSANRLLELVLTSENRAVLTEQSLERIVTGARQCLANKTNDFTRVGTGILVHLFKQDEQSCAKLIEWGALESILYECRKNDVETLRHCAMALANLALYGGKMNHDALVKQHVPMWLFPLAFGEDDTVQYYACLAIVVLTNNPDIENEVINSGTLDLVEPFVMNHDPAGFAKSFTAHVHGQSINWLMHLVPLLSARRIEARNLAAFHFRMEAAIKTERGQAEVFREIGAIEPLKSLAKSPNAVAAKLAAQTLQLIGEIVPPQLTEQVPLWTTSDVCAWIKLIGFEELERSFADSHIDGDLLLQMSDENLRNDIGVTNGMQRMHFDRELRSLKKITDYSSVDNDRISELLQSISPEYVIYTYPFLTAGITKKTLRRITEDQLSFECGIANSIHRKDIIQEIQKFSHDNDDHHDRPLDIFISYRRSNGSQLASLLKVYLQLRGYSVFLDVEQLENGKFDENILKNLRDAKHFLLLLTPNALDRCINDPENKDWIRKVSAFFFSLFGFLFKPCE